MYLHRYAQILGLDSCGVYGVHKAGHPKWTCNVIWTPNERSFVLEALEIAQDKIERELRYPLSAKYICDEIQPWGNRGRIRPLNWMYVQKLGVLTQTLIETDVQLTLTDPIGIIDPVEVVVNTLLSESCEIAVYHTAENGGERIIPSSVIIDTVAETVTILIPRCRLVNPTLVQPDTGFEYVNDNNFVDAIDVYRRYIDESTGKDLLWAVKSCQHSCGCGTCGETYNSLCEMTIQTACGVIENAEKSWISLWPAEYENFIWRPREFTIHGRCPEAIQVSYLANYGASCGLNPYCDDPPKALERAIVRLAHTELPYAPCGCSIQENFWKFDREEVSNFEPNPFGYLRGSIYAWQAIKQYVHGGGGLL